MKYIKKFELYNFNDELQTDIVNTVTNNDDVKLKTYLDKYKDYNFDFNYNAGFTPFLYGVLFDCEKTVKLLIEKGVNLNKQEDKSGHSGLMLCIIREQIDMLKILIDAGADWSITNNNGYEFLDYLQQPLKNQYKIKTKFVDILEIISKNKEKYKDYLIRKDVEKYNI